MANKIWDISYRSDIYEVQVDTEDGFWHREHESFYVVATDPSGRRFAHFHSWTTEKMSKAEAMASAMNFAYKVSRAQGKGEWFGPNEHWVEIQPEYGSPAYTGEVGFEQDLMEARANGEESEFLDSARRAGRVF